MTAVQLHPQPPPPTPWPPEEASRVKWTCSAKPSPMGSRSSRIMLELKVPISQGLTLAHPAHKSIAAREPHFTAVPVFIPVVLPDASLWPTTHTVQIPKFVVNCGASSYRPPHCPRLIMAEGEARCTVISLKSPCESRCNRSLTLSVLRDSVTPHFSGPKGGDFSYAHIRV